MKKSLASFKEKLEKELSLLGVSDDYYQIKYSYDPIEPDFYEFEIYFGTKKILKNKDYLFSILAINGGKHSFDICINDDNLDANLDVVDLDVVNLDVVKKSMEIILSFFKWDEDSYSGKYKNIVEFEIRVLYYPGSDYIFVIETFPSIDDGCQMFKYAEKLGKNPQLL